MHHELWFKGGSKLVKNANFTPTKQHETRLEKNDFISLVEKFIHSKRLNTKNLDMYAVIIFSDKDDTEPAEIHDLETWSLEHGIITDESIGNAYTTQYDPENYDSLFSHFKCSDNDCIKYTINDIRNRAAYGY